MTKRGKTAKKKENHHFSTKVLPVPRGAHQLLHKLEEEDKVLWSAKKVQEDHKKFIATTKKLTKLLTRKKHL